MATHKGFLNVAGTTIFIQLLSLFNLLLVIHYIMYKVSKIDHCGDILIKNELSQVVINSKYDDTVHGNNLTVTDHGLGMSVLLPSL